MEEQTAKHVWISELTGGIFVQKDDAPTAVDVQGRRIYRARLYGTVVSTDEVVIDDSTGSLLVRAFDNPINVNIGDIVLVIGKPRIHNNEQYILGEIIKKIDEKWLEIRNRLHPKPNVDQKGKVIDTVRKLDSGDGADYNKVVADAGNNTEELIVHLIAVGELFETTPGKLKVLE